MLPLGKRRDFHSIRILPDQPVLTCLLYTSEPGKVLPNGQIADCSTALKETLLAVKDAYEGNPGTVSYTHLDVYKRQDSEILGNFVA